MYVTDQQYLSTYVSTLVTFSFKKKLIKKRVAKSFFSEYLLSNRWLIGWLEDGGVGVGGGGKDKRASLFLLYFILLIKLT